MPLSKASSAASTKRSRNLLGSMVSRSASSARLKSPAPTWPGASAGMRVGGTVGGVFSYTMRQRALAAEQEALSQRELAEEQAQKALQQERRARQQAEDARREAERLREKP